MNWHAAGRHSCVHGRVPTRQHRPESLRRFSRPIYFALGGLSNPDNYQAAAIRLSRLFPDFTLEVFEDRHPFDTPHRIEPERLADSLLSLWRRAEPDN